MPPKPLQYKEINIIALILDARLQNLNIDPQIEDQNSSKIDREMGEDQLRKYLIGGFTIIGVIFCCQSAKLILRYI